MRLGERVRGALVAEEVAQVCQRRAGNGELPIEHGYNRPPPGEAPYQQVASVEVAVDQARFLIQTGQLRRPPPHQAAGAAAQISRHAPFEVDRRETQIHESRRGVLPFQQRRRDGRPWTEPSRPGEGDAANRRQSFSRGIGRLRRRSVSPLRFRSRRLIPST